MVLQQENGFRVLSLAVLFEKGACVSADRGIPAVKTIIEPTSESSNTAKWRHVGTPGEIKMDVL